MKVITSVNTNSDMVMMSDDMIRDHRMISMMNVIADIESGHVIRSTIVNREVSHVYVQYIR